MGGITMLIGLAKVGKTTFLLDLLAAMNRGVPFLGQLLPKIRTIYVTEQSPHIFRVQAAGAGITGLSKWLPYAKVQMLGCTWAQMCERIREVAEETGAKLLILDTWAGLAGFSGEAENHTGEAMTRLEALQPLLAAGMSVIISVHEGKPTKGPRSLVNAGRGASALAGGVDQILWLQNPGGVPDSEFRVLRAEGRYPETPTRQMVLTRNQNPYIDQKLSGHPTDWAKVPYLWAYFEKDSDQKSDQKPETPAKRPQGQTIQEVMATKGVDRMTARRLLQGSTRTGTGKRGDPYRYTVSGE